MTNKKNENKRFEDYYPNGQLAFRFWKKEIKEIVLPQETYGNFYWRIFRVRKEPNFLSQLQEWFKTQLEFLTQLGFEELSNDDELHYDKSFQGLNVWMKCKSYHKNGHLKFEYTFDNSKHPYWNIGDEKFELFYEDAQPKFRFKYQEEEEDTVLGNYQTFYNNGQLKERGDNNFDGDEFERFSKKGQIIERRENKIFYKYYDNEKLHYWITLNGNRKHGPFEIYDRDGKLIEKGEFSNDEMFDGLYETYYEDGQIDKRCYYKNGVLDGPYQESYANGLLKITTFYKNGVLHGPYQELYAHKGMKENIFYINGKRMDVEERC